jgi:hypothetical protein
VGGSRSRRSTAAKKLFAGTEVGTFVAPTDVESSFCWGYYSPSTNLDHSEWEVMYRQFVDSGLVVKPEPPSDFMRSFTCNWVLCFDLLYLRICALRLHANCKTQCHRESFSLPLFGVSRCCYTKYEAFFRKKITCVPSQRRRMRTCVRITATRMRRPVPRTAPA